MLGLIHISDDFGILKALNPYYGIRFLTVYPEGFWLLGAVFLCTTGAEALYSDLGHCGRGNIRISWMFVKVCLLLNYFGQGASLLKHHSGQLLNKATINAEGINALRPDAGLVHRSGCCDRYQRRHHCQPGYGKRFVHTDQ